MAKVLLIIPGINRGSDKFALRLAKELHRRYGYEFVIVSRWFSPDHNGYLYKLYDVEGNVIRGWGPEEREEFLRFIERNGPYDLIHTHTATITLDGDLDAILNRVGRKSIIFTPHGSFVVRAFDREFLPFREEFYSNPRETLDNLIRKGARPGGYEEGGKNIEKILKEWWSREENKELLDAYTYENSKFKYPWQKWWLLGFFKELEERTIEKSDVVVQVSYWINNMFNKIYGDNHKKKSIVIRDGIHYTEIFKDPKKYKIIRRIADFYKRIYGNSNKVWYVFIGAWEPEKGIFDLMKAYKIVKSRKRDVGLIIIGGTSNKKVKKYIERFGHEIGDVHLYSPLYNNKLDDLHLAGLLLALKELGIGVYVHPAWVEDFGLAPLEAAYIGLPVIVYNLGGPQEILVKNGLAVGVKPHDIYDLSEKMVKVAYNVRDYINDKNKHIIEKYFSFDKVVNEYHKLYSSLIR